MNNQSEEYIKISNERWFTPEEIYDILLNYKQLSFNITLNKINQPKGFFFFLFYFSSVLFNSFFTYFHSFSFFLTYF